MNLTDETVTNTLPVAWEPREISNAFAAAYNSGEVANLLALYESQPTLVAVGSHADNRNLDGTAKDVGQELLSLVSLGGRIECQCLYALKHGELALVSAQWCLSGLTDPNGNPIPDITGRSTEIARQQPDGRWLYVIDHPNGASHI